MEYGTTNPLTIELQNIGLPRHLSLLILEKYSQCLVFENDKLVEFREDILKNAMINEDIDEYQELKEILYWDN